MPLVDPWHVYGTPLLRVAFRLLRHKHGWSQDVFADLSGLNRAHVGEIERGESNVTLQTLKLVADTLGVNIRDLLNGVKTVRNLRKADPSPNAISIRRHRANN